MISLLVSFVWESAVIDGVLRVLLIIKLTTDLVKSFHEANFLIVLISDGNLSVEHIRDARVTRLLVHEVQYAQDTKLVKLTYRPVFVSFQKLEFPSGDDSSSEE